jgi:hypothetical protein
VNIHITIDGESPVEVRKAMQELLGSTALSTIDETPYTPAEQANRTLPVYAAKEAADAAPTAQRERGKPSPGNARRTKAEIAEDEAADAADAAVKKAGEETGAIVADKQVEERGNISMSPEDRRDPNNPDDQQDAADEAAETAAGKDAEKPLTLDDVRAALGKYVKAYGMAAAQEDGPILIKKVLGDESKSKISDLPDDQAVLAKAIAGVDEMLEKNPFRREANL